MAVLTNADGKRMYGMVATRAGRVQQKMKSIVTSAKVKRPGVTQLARIRKMTQEALGELNILVDILEELGS